MSAGTVVALSGGIGGAKLALGLYRVLPPGALTVVCNPGDDFDHLGLRICPDLDTVLYTLAGIANPGDRLGAHRRDVDLHAGAGRARRRDLVPAGGRRSRLARRTHAPPCAGRAVVAHCRGHCAPLRSSRAGGARLRRRGADHRDDAGWPPRVPALLRARPVRAGGDRLRIRRRRGRSPVQRRAGGPRRPLSALRGGVPFQPIHQHRPDPGRARHESRDPCCRGARDRRVAHRRRRRGEGSHRQDDGRARIRCLQSQHRATLRGRGRRMGHRHGRYGGLGRVRPPGPQSLRR